MSDTSHEDWIAAKAAVEELIIDAEDNLHDARTAFMRGDFSSAAGRLESTIVLAGDALAAVKSVQAQSSEER